MEKQTFYFTFGASETMPFQSGWVEVVATSREEAVNIFNRRFPPKHGNFVNCAFIYDEKAFMATNMYRDGNFGAKCQERLSPFEDEPVR